MARTVKAAQKGADNDEGSRTLRMSRGVSQLLYHYLPYKTVDWDDGRAIVQLSGLQLRSAWSDDRVTAVLAEIAAYLENWTRDGGTVDPNFPDPNDPARFTIGEPTGINANVFRTAFRCRRCSRLYFPQGKHAQLPSSLDCPSCKQASLRQFPFVFVHGCGDMHPIEAFLPSTRTTADGSWEIKDLPRLKCRTCGEVGEPAILTNSERIRDMRVVCLRCKNQIQQRLDANCPRCFKRLIHKRAERAEGDEAGIGSLVQRTAMRVARYSQNEAYYPATISILRLDRPDITVGTEDPRLAALLDLLPPEQQKASTAPSHAKLTTLMAQLKRAEDVGDTALQDRLLSAIAAAAVANGPRVPAVSQPQATSPAKPAPEDVVKSARESRALLTTVSARSVTKIATEGGEGARELGSILATITTRLGFSELSVVSDFPIIACTFGYTRRSFTPTYDELNATGLPTELRAFPGLDHYAAQRLASPGAEGTVPLPAREGLHEGLLFTLEPTRVVRWLTANQVDLPRDTDERTLHSLLRGLEPIDRFHDQIWKTRLRRYLFGLVHTMSHVVMRAAARFAGMERTSISEYIFLPLLGGVLYDNASVFQLGGLRTLARDNLLAFLEAVSDEAVRCLYDPDCTDHRGACHGCIHSPEICCRVFNHGLSRSFLLGGHAPWADVASDEQLVGFWDVD